MLSPQTASNKRDRKAWIEVTPSRKRHYARLMWQSGKPGFNLGVVPDTPTGMLEAVLRAAPGANLVNLERLLRARKDMRD
jgi:hypothetical protein